MRTEKEIRFRTSLPFEGNTSNWTTRARVCGVTLAVSRRLLTAMVAARMCLVFPAALVLDDTASLSGRFIATRSSCPRSHAALCSTHSTSPAIQYSTVQNSTIHYNTVQYSRPTVQHHAVAPSALARCAQSGLLMQSTACLSVLHISIHTQSYFFFDICFVRRINFNTSRFFHVLNYHIRTLEKFFLFWLT